MPGRCLSDAARFAEFSTLEGELSFHPVAHASVMVAVATKASINLGSALEVKLANKQALPVQTHLTKFGYRARQSLVFNDV